MTDQPTRQYATAPGSPVDLRRAVDAALIVRSALEAGVAPFDALGQVYGDDRHGAGVGLIAADSFALCWALTDLLVKTTDRDAGEILAQLVADDTGDHNGL